MATMREDIYDALYPMFEELVDTTCKHIEEIENNKDDINIDYIIKTLDKLKSINPEQKFVIETYSGSVELQIGDALIYEGINGEIVIDSE